MNHSDPSYTLTPIGHVHSPFKEKFGVPRQPSLCQVHSTLVLDGEGMTAESVEGLTQHSHIWVLFLFHQNLAQGWKPKVRPPRLGGNEKLGVLATRSSFRPNGIGMSVVALKDIKIEKGQVCIHVHGLDLVDGTPIVDIKPYIPYVDALPEATSSLAPLPPGPELSLVYSSECIKWFKAHEANYPDLKILLEQLLGQDPRPSYKKNKTDERIYGIKLYDLNIRWRVQGSDCLCISIETCDD